MGSGWNGLSNSSTSSDRRLISSLRAAETLGNKYISSSQKVKEYYIKKNYLKFYNATICHLLIISHTG